MAKKKAAAKPAADTAKKTPVKKAAKGASPPAASVKKSSPKKAAATPTKKAANTKEKNELVTTAKKQPSKATVKSLALIPDSPGEKKFQAELLFDNALRTISDRWDKDEAAAAVSSVSIGFRRACELKEVSQDYPKYGSNADVDLCKRHDISDARKKAMLNVAERIPAEMVDQAIVHNQTLSGRYGKVSFEHLIEISKVKDADARWGFFRTTVDYKLNVSQTVAYIIEDSQDKLEAGEDPAIKPRITQPVRSAKDFAKVTVKLVESTKAIDAEDFVESVMLIKKPEQSLSAFDDAIRAGEMSQVIMGGRLETLRATRQALQDRIDGCKASEGDTEVEDDLGELVHAYEDDSFDDDEDDNDEDVEVNDDTLDDELDSILNDVDDIFASEDDDTEVTIDDDQLDEVEVEDDSPIAKAAKIRGSR